MDDHWSYAKRAYCCIKEKKGCAGRKVCWGETCGFPRILRAFFWVRICDSIWYQVTIPLRILIVQKTMETGRVNGLMNLGGKFCISPVWFSPRPVGPMCHLALGTLKTVEAKKAWCCDTHVPRLVDDFAYEKVGCAISALQWSCFPSDGRDLHFLINHPMASNGLKGQTCRNNISDNNCYPISSLSHFSQGFIHSRWCMVVPEFFHQQYHLLGPTKQKG